MEPRLRPQKSFVPEFDISSIGILDSGFWKKSDAKEYLVEQSLLSLVVQGEGNVAGGALQGEGELFIQIRRKEKGIEKKTKRLGER